MIILLQISFISHIKLFLSSTKSRSGKSFGNAPPLPRDALFAGCVNGGTDHEEVALGGCTVEGEPATFRGRVASLVTFLCGRYWNSRKGSSFTRTVDPTNRFVRNTILLGRDAINAFLGIQIRASFKKSTGFCVRVVSCPSTSRQSFAKIQTFKFV